MTDAYKALKPIGRFQPGDIVAGLTAEQISHAVKDGVIVAVAKPAPAKEIKSEKGAIQ